MTAFPPRATRALNATLAALECAACASLLVLGTTSPAWAYVDPSVMTYTIQALAGVAVALSTVAGVLMRRTRKRLMNVLEIDENHHKQVEPDIHRLDARGNAVANRADRLRRKPRPARGSRPYRPGWRTRLGLAFAVSLFAVVTVVVVAPLEVLAASVGSVVFGIRDVWHVAFAMGGVALLGLTLLLTLLRGRAFSAALMLVFGLAMGAYLQAMFMNQGLPPADGNAVAWERYTTVTVLTGAVWALVIAVPPIASLRSRARAHAAAVALSCALTIVQGVALGSLFMPGPHADAVPAGHANGDLTVTERGLLNVSGKSNVVVFVLDTYDTQDLLRLLPDHPGMFDEFTGFTWYENCTGSLIPTRYAIPYLLTGDLPRDEQLWTEYTHQRYRHSDLLPTIKDAGYSIGVYSDSIYYESTAEGEGWQRMARHTLNVHPLSATEGLNIGGTVKALGKIALYRDLPWALKPPFWFFTDEINVKMARMADQAAPDSVPYVMDDAAYFKKQRAQGLSVNDDDAGEKGSFRFIHLLGTHYPYLLDENGENIGAGNSDLDRQALGSMKMVEDYIRQLKRLGLYDRTTIVVTADHGYWYLTKDPIEKPTSPIMLVKPAQSAQLDAQPLKRSKAPVSHLDYPATILKALGVERYRDYGTPLDEVPESVERPRSYLMTTSDGTADRRILEFMIEGDALDFSNWRLTGRAWEVDQTRRPNDSSSERLGMRQQKTD
ncbi:sulfatase-like hydrolase/transferase [Berryella wangjianweii]|uniref:Sulfatase-like hydrolase/transferase n=1 Tax=Berryella wangjianweii TaxID=2734634 RepID=A0A6M8J284_9ACTN|nr:sulfatase-like hydrolase/transferase [Berryella wangjianweii]QKF07654.1 sulfatase-like hydrolase/transferase [Berryella wangjianweii]